MSTKYTIQDLKTMQAWPLWRKVQVTQTRILEWCLYYDYKVYVSFSGGKDSTVLLDLVRRVYPDCPAVFCDTGLEYPEIRAFVKTIDNVVQVRPEMPFSKVIEGYGYPVISKDIAKVVYFARQGSKWALNRFNALNTDGTKSKFKEHYIKYKYLIDAPFCVANTCCRIIKEHPLNKYSRANKMHAITGLKADDSFQRQQAWQQSGCNAYGIGKSKPMSFWLEQDVLQYLKNLDLPYASIYGDIVANGNGILATTGAKRTGCMFCMFGVHLEAEPNRFQRMQTTHPKHWNYCINKLGCGKVLDYIGVPYEIRQMQLEFI